MKIPNDVAPGQNVSAKDFNLILRFLRSLRLRGGPGIVVSQTMAGTSIRAVPPEVQNKTVASYKHPFKCTLAGTQLSIYPGMVNAQVPTIAGVALDAATAPTLNVITGLNVVYLKVSGVINTETGVETVARAVIELAASLPENTATEFAWTAYQTITRFNYSEETPPDSIPQFLQTNLRAANFGRYSCYFA